MPYSRNQFAGTCREKLHTNRTASCRHSGGVALGATPRSLPGQYTESRGRGSARSRAKYLTQVLFAAPPISYSAVRALPYSTAPYGHSVGRVLRGIHGSAGLSPN